jgi:hypothetical protein
MEKAKEPDEEDKKIGFSFFFFLFVFVFCFLSLFFVFNLYHSIFLTLNESDPLRV